MPRKEKSVETSAVEPTPSQVETTTSEGPQLTLADIKNAINIIDYAANQGTFKGWDVIAQVMQARQRLIAFVDVATPKVEGEPATTGETNQEVANA